MSKLNFSSSNIESKQNKVTNIGGGSTDLQYPSAKAVYDYVNNSVSTVSDNLQAQLNQRPLVGDYIVSRHSNANWEWVIYSSGWCECFGHLYIDTIIDSAWGSIYEGSGYSLNYPVTFREIPFEFGQTNLYCGTFTESYLKNTKTKSATYYPLRPNSGQGGDGYLYLRVAGWLA